MSGLDLTLDPERQPRRFEVINGAGGRRNWSMDDKARIGAVYVFLPSARIGSS